MKLQEIARLAGVSSATVSRVFSHHPNIRADVRAHVFAIAKAHHYHPRLSTKQRNVVIIAPGEAIYPIRNCLEMVMMALTRELPRRGYRIEILPQDNLDRLDSIQFCGAVAIGSEPEDFKRWADRFVVPLVLVDRDVPPGSSEVYAVRSDESQGMELAIEHLHGRGCRKIGCVIYGAPGSGNADLRRAAIVEALKSRGLPAQDSLIRLSGDDNYVEIVGKLLKQKVDALFCPGGNAGIVAAYALSLFNKRVPDDVSLIASEHKLFSQYATPSQTTITQDHGALAELAADAIEARLDGRPFPQRSVLPYS
ncbi:MAG: LacI family DNA-binding transcriptional regulator, partial [Kiritimatiellae bacterium]|nr:LacI family DNA-binding transcriptional regulator [Kiritimatiellia bacterium]